MANKKEVAEHLFISESKFTHLQQEGVLPKAIGRGGFDVDDCRRRYIKHLEESSRSADFAPVDDEKMMRLDMERAELNNEERRLKIQERDFNLKVKRKEFAPINIIEVCVKSVALSLHSRIEARKPKLKALWPDMPQEASAFLDKDHADLLNELAHVQPDLSDYIESDQSGGDVGVESP